MWFRIFLCLGSNDLLFLICRSCLSVEMFMLLIKFVMLMIKLVIRDCVLLSGVSSGLVKWVIMVVVVILLTKLVYVLVGLMVGRILCCLSDLFYRNW